MNKKKIGKPAIHPETIAKGLGLSKQQQEFAEHYVYCGMDGVSSAKACYQVNYDKTKYSEEKREWYEELVYRGIAKENLRNKNVVAYIKELKDQLNENLGVDKYYVVDQLKRLAKSGSEATQIRALELLGKTLSMFNEVQKVDISEDKSAGDLAREAFEKRKEMMKQQKFEIYKTGTENNEQICT